MAWYNPFDWGKTNAADGINAKPGNYNAATAQLGQIAGLAPKPTSFWGAAKQAMGAGAPAPAGVAGRAAPQVTGTQLAGGPQDQARQGLQGVATRLGAVAGGQAPGAGELAVNRQVGQATAAQTSLARSARGANAALAYRNAARNVGDIGQAGAGQAAQAQLADQQAANAQLAGVYGQMRGQDLDLASQNASLGQAAQLANVQAQLQQTGMNDAQQIAALGQLLGWDQAQIQAQIQRAAIDAQDTGIFPSLLQQAGSIGAVVAASDERLKKKIKDGAAAADEFMRNLHSTEWEYRDKAKFGPGRRLGILAQDLERSKMGRETVVKVDDAGHIGFDVGKAANASLAAVARLHERLERVEGSIAARAARKGKAA